MLEEAVLKLIGGSEIVIVHVERRQQKLMDDIQKSYPGEARAEGPWSTLALETIAWKACAPRSVKKS